MSYEPHIGHAVAITFISTLFGCLGILIDDMRPVMLAAAILSGVIVLTILLLLIWDANSKYYTSVARAASEVAKLDDHRFQIFAMTFPNIRVRWANNIQPVIMFDDCEVATMSHLAIFINGSNTQYTFPKREWHGTVTFRGEEITLSMAAYEEILGILIEKKLVVPDSATGPRSWLWVNPETYRNVRKYWSSWITNQQFISQGEYA